MKKFLFVLFGSVALAQTPDIIIRFPSQGGTWTTPATSPFSGGYDNRNQGIFYWMISYQATNCTALSLQFESANGASTPGAFGAFSGTVDKGVNPNTNTTQATTTFEGYVSWYRVNLSSMTGVGCSVSGTLYGFRTAPAAIGGQQFGGSGCPGTLATPCDVQGLQADAAALAGNPVRVCGSDGANCRTVLVDSSGRAVGVGAAAPGAAIVGNPVRVAIAAQGNVQDILSCPNTVIVNDSTMGLTQIIAASGSTKIYICKITLTTAAPVNIQLQQGTGANCGTGTANLGGLYQSAVTVADDYGSDFTWLTSAASQAVCLNLGAATQTTGTISYAQN
jgi:hypothetical protein